MNRRILLSLAIAACVAASVASPRKALAIAAFSRQYDVECSTCHNPFPHRNEFGEAFRKNGYAWPGRVVKEKPAGTKEAFWLSAIPENFPLSVSLREDVQYESQAEDDKISPNTDVFLHLGGTLRDVVGFFGHDLLGGSSGELFAVFRRLAATPLNVKLGRISPQTTLWKENQSLTITPPVTLTFSVPGGGSALSKPRDAVELNAVLGSRFFAAAGVADRKDQDAMDYFGHLSWKVGGTDFLGQEPELDLERESLWDYLTLTFGTFAYLGRIEQPNRTRYRRLGLEAEAQYRGLTVLLSGVSARDEDVDAGGLNVDSVVFAAEADYFFAPRYLVSARFEQEHVGNSDQGLTRRGILGASWVPLESLEFKVEVKHSRSDGEDDNVDTVGWLQATIHL